jgi:hypothetical protein
MSLAEYLYLRRFLECLLGCLPASALSVLLGLLFIRSFSPVGMDQQ